MSDMGGVKHFNVAVDTPNGSIELLKKVLEGANKEVDEGAEERKGGAGHLGKCFFSAGDEAVRSSLSAGRRLGVCHACRVDEQLGGLPNDARPRQRPTSCAGGALSPLQQPLLWPPLISTALCISGQG